MKAACRAGIWPNPAGTTVPLITWPSRSFGVRERVTTSRMTAAPRSIADIAAKAPPSFPKGVLAPAVMTTSSMLHSVSYQLGDRRSAIGIRYVPWDQAKRQTPNAERRLTP